MAILTFLIGAILFVGGLGALALCVNLIPTEIGLLYAISGVVLLSAAGIVAAIGALIVHLSRISAPRPKTVVKAPPAAETAPLAPEPAVEFVPESRADAIEDALLPVEVEREEDVNLNRSGRLPTLRAMEEAIAEPEGQPKIVGRYSAGGAKYVIFSDGAIEAETEEGAYRFGSMDEFKSFIAGRKR